MGRTRRRQLCLRATELTACEARESDLKSPLGQLTELCNDSGRYQDLPTDSIHSARHGSARLYLSAPM